MSLFTSVLQPATNHRSRNQIILWWERRRVLYNVLLLIAGGLTLLIGCTLGHMTFENPSEFLPPILLFVISANLFYTLGWVVEIASNKFITQRELTQQVGPILFIAGTCFSLFITFIIDIAILFSYFFYGAPQT
jgi:hypothetical protein